MYYIVYGLLWLVSLLPMRVLYVLADGLYGLVFYLLKYRRDVVMANLAIAFPEKTETERRKIAKRFYHNLIDTFIETVKMLSSGQRFLSKRFTANWEVINDLKVSGKKVQLHLGHNFNWEWGNAVAVKKFNMPLLAVYMPLASKIFERLFYRLRSRYGTILLRATHMQQDFLPYRKEQYLLGLVADQNPGDPSGAFWFNFFGRPTPFVKGPARGAINNGTAVVFAFIHRVKRGYYEAVFSLVTSDATGQSEEALTRAFVKYLEQVIKKYPDMWLWSHRRWKHEWKPEYGPVLEK